MKVVRRGIFGILGLMTSFILMSTLIIGGTSVQSFNATAGGISLSPKTFVEKTGFPITEEVAEHAIAFAERLMSRHKLTLEQTSGVLAVAYRESRFDVTAINDSGGVAGFFQWSGWSSTLNGNRWGLAKSRELTLPVELELMSAELDGSFHKVIDQMSGVSTPFEAAKIWSYYYEGVELHDAQSALGDVEKWSQVILAALQSGQAQFFEGTESGAATLEIPEGWSIDNPYNGKDYNHSGSYPAGQCTWYVYNRAKQLGIVYDDYMGNGGEWWYKSGYTADHIPRKHVAVSFPAGLPFTDPDYGHVAFVEEIRNDGSILVSEMNMSGVPFLTASYRVIGSDLAKQAWYVNGK